ncbi:hypothetical protein GCK72_009436 [Caenorhabditis remanei]|uniref:BRCT domain-containing protein n=1 Tax=Caenorhabditis remanei TaxID=31234 RepID=A0A6A5H3X4_CAERE|nr:hypothetical protein GCK72_009436 [Caenorhabditis remanei]KAF1761182.1 hypothetical protein GCK72_009436 [Caenorhabditis remanei]
MRHPIVSSLILVIWTSTWQNVNGEEDSPLKLIHNELSILSRVTNAIALEAASLKKSVKIRDVITEILEVNSGNFSDIVELNPDSLTKTLDGIQRIRQKIQESLAQTNEKMTKQELFDMASLNDLLVFTNDNYEDENRVHSDEIMKNARGNTSIILICDIKLVESMSRFGEFLNGVSKGNTIDLGIISTIQNSRSDIQKCLKRITGYSDAIAQTKLELSLIGSMSDVIDVIKDMKEKDIINKLPSDLRIFQSMFSLILNAVKSYEKNSSGNLLNSTINLLKNVLNREESHHHHHHYYLTAGFPEIEDMSSVMNDLKSDWFREKISKGKSIEELENALAPFAHFAGKIKNVHQSWSLFQKSFTKADEFLTTISRGMDVIEKYDFSRDEETYFRDFQSGITSCLSFFKYDYDEGLEESFRNDYELLAAYVESVDSLEEWSQRMNDMLSPAFDLFLNKFSQIRKEGKKNARDIKEEIKDLINFESSEKVFSMFDNLKNLQKTHMEHDESTRNLRVTISEVAKSTGFFETSKCLREKKFDTEQLTMKISLVNSILDVTLDIFDELKTILNLFSKMRTELFDAEDFVKETSSRNQRDVSQKSKNSILKLENSEKLSDHLGNGMRILSEMIETLEKKNDILKSANYGQKVDNIISKSPIQHVKSFWNSDNRNAKIKKLVEDLESLESSASEYRKGDLMTTRKIFDKAVEVDGLPDVYPYIYDILLKKKNTEYDDVLENSKKLMDLDLDFSNHKGELSAASLSLEKIKEYFDDIFELNPIKEDPAPVTQESTSIFLVIILCLAIFLTLIICAVVAYGFTPSGKRTYKKLYLYYFGKPVDYEKRWRYSLFLDRTDGKNVLIDAVREINSINLNNAVKKGAYINVCNKFGNTSLHVATRRGYPELVEILIKNGADRAFLNAQNKTPEQMIPENYSKTEEEKTERYMKIELIYEKYRKRKFKQRVPEQFPVSSFHIYIEERTDDTITNEFTTKFQAITSDEVMPTTTHCIVKTSTSEILETDDINILSWIFNGIIIVKDTWMTECLKNKKLIEKDCDYLVEKIRYKEVVYDTVIQWSNAMAKGTIPYLYGVHVVFVMKESPILAAMIINQGGTVLDSFPEKDSFNKGSHPYLHNHLGPIFILHDGKTDLTPFRKDPDRMFTLFTEQEFLVFMLKREIDINTCPKPIPVLVEGDD